MRIFGRDTSVVTALGGAAFACSIAYCAWTYVVTWQVPHNHSVSPANIAFDALLFGVFAMHHSLTARTAVKAQMAGLIGEASIRTAYVWIASVLLAVVCVAWRPIGPLLYRRTGSLAIALAAIQIGGVWLSYEALRSLDPLELAGLGASTRASVVQTGPFRWVRHPLYTGWMLVTFGAPTMTADRLGFAIISSAYLLIAIPWEEAALRRELGRAYIAYSERVRWRVIPFVY
jgi:methanethiol S-methyltransferase